MKIVIEQDDGKQLSLDTVSTIIPEGHTVLICPMHEGYMLSDWQKAQLLSELIALGIRACVVQLPVCVWTVADDARR